MKCEKCGREIPEDKTICEECREEQNENNEEISDQELLNRTIEAVASDVTETEEQQEDDHSAEESIPEASSSEEALPEETLNLKEAAAVISLFAIPRLLTLAAVICLLFTFMKITYGGQLTEISGKDLIFGGSSISLKEHDSQEYKADGDMFNWFVMLGGIAALGALAARTKDAYKCGTAAAVLLIIFRLTARIYYQIGDMSIEEYEANGWMKVEFCGGLYCAIVLLLLASVMYFGVAKLKHIKMNSKYWKPMVH